MNVKESIQGETNQGNCSQISAGCRLNCIRSEGTTISQSRHLSLEPGEYWHNEERCDCDADANVACLRVIASYQRHDGCHRNHCTQDKEQNTSPTSGTIF